MLHYASVGTVKAMPIIVRLGIDSGMGETSILDGSSTSEKEKKTAEQKKSRIKLID
jgi:hypothetical protein